MMNNRERITQLEQALQRVGVAKKQLCRNTSEAKSRIQCDISRQLEALRNREVWLLNQLDIVSGAKEEVLQQQTARLNKTLGSLQSGSYTGDVEGQMYPKMDRLDVTDLQPEETPYVCFKSDPASLRDAITRYGKIDANTVTPLHSPYMVPEYPAPSLPRHFEDYDDAEHHVLYKTVEEINRLKTEQACVYVNIPKLSTRVEDWLLHPGFSATPTISSQPQYTFPNLSNDISDWLQPARQRGPRMSIDSGSSSSRRGDLRTLERISADASITTWLHKIKQSPYEEEEDGFEFVDEVSDTRTQMSGDLQLEQFPEPVDVDSMWLTAGGAGRKSAVNASELALDKWLMKAESRMEACDAVTMDMSRYFTNIADELDIWLLNGSCNARKHLDDVDHHEPSIVDMKGFHDAYTSLSGSNSPWLLGPRSRSRSRSNPRVRSMSPKDSRMSLHSSFSSLYSEPSTKNKWLLTSQGNAPPTSYIPCPTMEKYFHETKHLSWLSSGRPSTSVFTPNYNPLENYISHHKGADNSKWLLTLTSLPTKGEVGSPLENILEKYRSVPTEHWLMHGQESSESMASGQCHVDVPIHLPVEDDRRWLVPTSVEGAELCDDDI